MDDTGGGWTVMNELKADGSCQHPTGLDGEVTLQQKELENCTFMHPHHKRVGKSNSHLDSTVNSAK